MSASLALCFGESPEHLDLVFVVDSGAAEPLDWQACVQFAHTCISSIVYIYGHKPIKVLILLHVLCLYVLVGQGLHRSRALA